MCRPSDSPAIKLFSGEEKVCSKQNRFFGCTGKCPFFLEAGTTGDAKSPPDRRVRVNQTNRRLGFFWNDPPHHRQRLSDDQCPRSVRAVFDNVLINVVARGAFEGAQVEVGFCWFDSRKMHHRATFCAGGGREFWIRT